MHLLCYLVIAIHLAGAVKVALDKIIDFENLPNKIVSVLFISFIIYEVTHLILMAIKTIKRKGGEKLNVN